MIQTEYYSDDFYEYPASDVQEKNPYEYFAPDVQEKVRVWKNYRNLVRDVVLLEETDLIEPDEAYGSPEHLLAEKAASRYVQATVRGPATTSEFTHLYSKALPTISITLSMLSLVVALIFVAKGLFLLVLPAVFAMTVFGALGLIIGYVRKRVQRAWRHQP